MNDITNPSVRLNSHPETRRAGRAGSALIAVLLVGLVAGCDTTDGTLQADLSGAFSTLTTAFLSGLGQVFANLVEVLFLSLI